MLNYVLRRISLLLFTLLILSGFAYGIRLSFLRSEEMADDLTYSLFIQHFLRGEWGISSVTGQPVLDTVLHYLPASLGLIFTGAIFAAIFGTFTGTIAAVYRDRWPDHVLSNLSLLVFSIPVYWLATLAMMFLAMQLGWFPSSGQLSLLYNIEPITGFSLLDCWISKQPNHMDALTDAFQHLLLPALVLGMSTATEVFRLVKHSLSDVLSQNYIKAAQSRGVALGMVVLKHGLRNAIPPILPMLSMQFGTLVTAAIITEQMFEWPGLGRWLVTSISARDFESVQACMLVVAITLVVINILAEIVTVMVYPAKRKELYAQQG